MACSVLLIQNRPHCWSVLFLDEKEQARCIPKTDNRILVIWRRTSPQFCKYIYCKTSSIYYEPCKPLCSLYVNQENHFGRYIQTVVNRKLMLVKLGKLQLPTRSDISYLLYRLVLCNFHHPCISPNVRIFVSHHLYCLVLLFVVYRFYRVRNKGCFKSHQCLFAGAHMQQIQIY